MRDIYANASETAVWLGNAADDSNVTLDLTDILSNVEVDMEDLDEALRLFYQPVGNCKCEGHWIALNRLLARPYWR